MQQAEAETEQLQSDTWEAPATRNTTTVVKPDTRFESRVKDRNST
jgi:hypothetical protein